MVGEEGASTRFSLWVEKKKGVGAHLFSLRLKFCVKISFWHQTCSSLAPLVCEVSKLCFVCTMARSQCKKSQCLCLLKFQATKKWKNQGCFFFGGGLRVKGCPFLHKGRKLEVI